MEEEKLLTKIKNNDDDAFIEMITKYNNMIHSIIRRYSDKYPYIKLSKEDLYQEACISLFSACKSYDPSKKTKFSTFAYRVIYCQIGKEVIKTLKVIQNEVMLYDSEESIQHIKYIKDNEFVYMPKHYMNEYVEKIKYLSSEDQTIIKMRLSNYSYKEIANRLHITTKRVDNRLAKLKRKWYEGNKKNKS